jgi:hypothetical protein
MRPRRAGPTAGLPRGRGWLFDLYPADGTIVRRAPISGAFVYDVARCPDGAVYATLIDQLARIDPDTGVITPLFALPNLPQHIECDDGGLLHVLVVNDQQFIVVDPAVRASAVSTPLPIYDYAGAGGVATMGDRTYAAFGPYGGPYSLWVRRAGSEPGFTEIGTLTRGDLCALVAEGDRLYGSACDGGGVYSIDTATGRASLLFETPGVQILGLSR